MTDPIPAQPYLYLLVRKDLHSMNAGKAVAHGAHAANQFTYQMEQWRSRHDLNDKDTDVALVNQWNTYQAWLRSAFGFGTTITLHVTLRELQTAVMVANSIPGLVAGETVDPTYPYILNREYARLIDHDEQVDWNSVDLDSLPPMNEPQPIDDRGNMLCLRKETTAAYVFGHKSLAKAVVGNFPLMP